MKNKQLHLKLLWIWSDVLDVFLRCERSYISAQCSITWLVALIGSDWLQWCPGAFWSALIGYRSNQLYPGDSGLSPFDGAPFGNGSSNIRLKSETWLFLCPYLKPYSDTYPLLPLSSQQQYSSTVITLRPASQNLPPRPTEHYMGTAP